MKSYEKESLLKNFLVFFSLLEVLLLLLFWELYHSQKEEYKRGIFKSMQLCSYTFSCEQFIFDFASKKDTTPNQLYHDKGLYSYFQIPKSQKFYLKITYPKEALSHDMKAMQKSLWFKYIAASLLLALLALFFTFYSLKPIRKALTINDEFVKDILHDFNTPITAMRLNIDMFRKKSGENIFIQNISHSIETIMMLENNLKSFLHHSPAQVEMTPVATLAQKRLHLMQARYPNITFHYHKKEELHVQTHPQLLSRILDNLLSNAAKYNKPQGSVTLTIQEKQLLIEDTGPGINDVKKVFNRYYTEQERGIGLGLHIVEKLAHELDIMIAITSTKEKGTTITLDFSHITQGLS